MELSHLKYFQLTAKLQHITKAASQLYISQPALSKTISKLEHELGVKLFDREGKGLYLNEYGKAVLKHTERIFSELDEMKREISDMKDGTSGSLRIATVWSSSNPLWLTSSIGKFMPLYPNIHIQYFKTELERLEKQLTDGEIDIAFSSAPLASPTIEWTPLFSEKIGIVLSDRHHFAKRSSLHMIDLKDEKFCIMDVNSDSSRLTLELCQKAHFTPNICYSLDNPFLIAYALTNADCVSIISENGYIQSHSQDKNLGIPDDKVFIPLEDDFAKRTCYMGTLTKRYQTKAQLDFIATLRQAIDSVNNPG